MSKNPESGNKGQNLRPGTELRNNPANTDEKDLVVVDGNGTPVVEEKAAQAAEGSGEFYVVRHMAISTPTGAKVRGQVIRESDLAVQGEKESKEEFAVRVDKAKVRMVEETSAIRPATAEERKVGFVALPEDEAAEQAMVQAQQKADLEAENARLRAELEASNRKGGSAPQNSK